ncbi:MAG: HNH endonuclease family protein [Thermoproteota archaeon]|jgi:hypothetical protein
MEQKSPEVAKIIEDFRAYLNSDNGKSHLKYLKEKEPREVKEILEKLKSLPEDSQEFVELVLYGLLPNAQSKYAKRVSTAPAFMNIKKFFARFNYTDDDWREFANLIYNLISRFQENPNNLENLIRDFTSQRLSKAIQCGSLSPIFFAIDSRFPIVNNREIRTFRRLSQTILGRPDELSQKLDGYLSNVQKIEEFCKILSKNYGFKEITDMAVFDLFCYWFDESTKKKVRGARPEKISEQKKLEEENIFEQTEVEQPLSIPKEARRVIWQAKDFNTKHLYDMWKEGELNIQPEFQRFEVWDSTKKSRLIESALLEVPIPPIYLAEENDGKYSVIDGQQRLRSFFDFFDGHLALRGLLVLRELNGKKFAELEKETKSSLRNFTPHVIIIKRESHPDIKFEIFERFNTGSVKLNDQELRNCIYRGEYNNLLKELSENKDFQFLLGLNKPHRRMIDRELILRFFAFYHNTYLRYEPPMKSFLNNEMDRYRNLDDEEEKLRKLFKKSVELTKIVFGENSFRRFQIGNETDPNGVWERRKINKALFDIVMYGFKDYEKHQIVPNGDAIREELIWLMTHDQEFIDSITISTNDKSRVLMRFEKWLRALREIVGYPQKEQRSFSLEVKRSLYRNNPTCRICGQGIHELDDAEVDHIDFYWRGGKTILPNARLVHRYCNRARGGRE